MRKPRPAEKIPPLWMPPFLTHSTFCFSPLIMVSKLRLDARTKLKTNIAIDVKSAGQPSKGVVAAAAKAPVVEAAAVAFKLQK